MLAGVPLRSASQELFEATEVTSAPRLALLSARRSSVGPTFEGSVALAELARFSEPRIIVPPEPGSLPFRPIDEDALARALDAALDDVGHGDDPADPDSTRPGRPSAMTVAPSRELAEDRAEDRAEDHGQDAEGARAGTAEEREAARRADELALEADFGIDPDPSVEITVGALAAAGLRPLPVVPDDLAARASAAAARALPRAARYVFAAAFAVLGLAAGVVAALSTR